MRALILLPLVLWPTASPAELTFEETAAEWRVSNGAIELIIDRERNYLRSLRAVGGPELLAEGGYWDSVTYREIGGKQEKVYSRLGQHAPVITEVVRRTPQMVDLCARTDPARFDPRNRLHAALLIEVHYVVMDGLPGLYICAVVRHDEHLPPTTLVQTRHVMRTDPHLMARYALSNERQGDLAPIGQFERAETIGDATFRLPDGRIVTKYQYSTANAESPVFGFTSADGATGLWAVRASGEYMTGGPTKQNLTVQNAGIMQVEVMNGHYMGPETRVALDGDWAMVYGPWLYLVNQGETLQELWEDAVARARDEAAEWPYEWCGEALGEDLYPLTRGDVAGRIVDHAGAPASGAWVILGGPEPNWQSQASGYRFWARTDDDGRFAIEKVRPGTYTMWAWQEGIPAEARVDGVSIAAGETTTCVDLRLPDDGTAGLVWRIGRPDRTAAEFRRGDDFRHWNLIGRYPDDFPEDVTFVIGESEERSDWNFAQPGPTVHEDRTRTQHPWTVVFSMDQPRDCRLILGIADSSYRPPAGIEVSVNGEAVGRAALAPGDSCAYRCGIQGHYQLAGIDVPAGALRPGENRLELVLPNSGAWVMYDFVAFSHAP
ncbi:MAG: carboxypeptidase regulatory-like domain-containing protein [Armatimonadetes bacterium]|nr:carboxypeptidase regulatory-like domain-containing protein [Armatimonadota bacterium]